MTINVERDFDLVTLGISGRLDTTTAPNLENTIKNLPNTVTELVFDMKQLEYISSAGLRVLLGAYKKMNAIGSMRIVSINDTLRETLEMTGLSSVFCA